MKRPGFNLGLFNLYGGFMYIPRLRYINDAVKEIKELDPDFHVTYTMIRHLIWTGKLTQLKYGSAWLVNMDELYAFFWGKRK